MKEMRKSYRYFRPPFTAHIQSLKLVHNRIALITRLASVNFSQSEFSSQSDFSKNLLAGCSLAETSAS